MGGTAPLELRALSSEPEKRPREYSRDLIGIHTITANRGPRSIMLAPSCSIHWHTIGIHHSQIDVCPYECNFVASVKYTEG